MYGYFCIGCNTDSHSYTNTDANCYRQPDTNSNSNSDSHAHTNPYTHTYTCTEHLPDGSTNQHTYTYFNPSAYKLNHYILRISTVYATDVKAKPVANTG